MISSKRFLILTAGGIGDQVLGFQCADSINLFKEKTNEKLSVTVCCCARNEVFKPLRYLFDQKFTVFQHQEEERWATNRFLENNLHLLEVFKQQYDTIYFVVPDHLFRHPLSFPYLEFDTYPQIIRSNRLLLDRYYPQGDIYVGLVTSTEGYLYYAIPELLIALAEKFPDRLIHFPLLKKWNNKPLYLGDFRIDFPKNVLIYANPDINDQIDLIRRSSYGIYTDNGMSHIAFQLGQPRLLLDPRFEMDSIRRSIPWLARWREDLTESVSIKTQPEEVARCVETNLRVPETMLLPRNMVLKNLNEDWSRELIFKY